MGTLRDYINWRGDLEFWQDGFNTIDNLVLSCLSYLELDEVFSDEGPQTLSIGDISKIYFDKVYPTKTFRDGSILKDAPLTLRAISDSNRYKNIRIRNYVSKTEVNRTLQFAAMEFLLPDGTSYVAYRGTDDSIVGWKEDFMLAISEVEAEKEAVGYLNIIAKDNDRLLRVGGHSKGGHLAVYASAKCDKPIRERILNIYSNDGPGFMHKIASSKAIADIVPKIVSIIPEESVVGLLMEPVAKPIVVKSTAIAVAQHNLATWQLEGKTLETVKGVAKSAQVLDAFIKENISKMSEEETEEFVDDLFGIFEATGALTLTELKNGGLKGIQAISKKATEIYKEKKSKNISSK
ncbi:MAG: DUF2974 domain-containing protein [Pseudobutyrivibrio sp.]|nr:DUF2974 domain-containing protein [Pseudobutyrivibrio sp.]